MEVEEFKKFREETTATLKDVENSISSTVQEAGANLSDQADIFETSFEKPPLDEKEVFRKSKRQGRNSWGVRRAARPVWFKRSAGIRTRVQSGAARMKRFHHSASK
jgi:sec-independent protein translocase protein TatB